MLNRRLLRVKAIQGSFALKQKTEANYQLGFGIVEDFFAPDLNSMEKPDMARLEFCKRKSKDLYKESYLTKSISNNQDEDITAAVQKALSFSIEQDKKDKEKVFQSLLNDGETLLKNYFSVLRFFVDLGQLVSNQRHQNENKKGEKIHVTSVFNLADNKILQVFDECSELKSELAKVSDDWLAEVSILRELFKEKISVHPAYKEYTSLETPTFEQDKKILLSISKKILFKSDAFIDYFDEKDTYWKENKEVLQNMVERTIKKLEEGEEVKIMKLTENWESDREFLKTLYYGTVDLDEDIKKEINSKLKNWDEDRVSDMDTIIIKMAIVEMINMESIPVKVSMNEYIDLSKKYSTPKSKEFVNGVLHAVSKVLLANKTIKKSGRGLIDNK